MNERNQEFKKLLIKKAFDFAKKVVSLADQLPKKTSVQIIINQLLRSATSIGANIIEAQAASSKRDFVNFLNHALKSANESKFWLLLLKEPSQEKHEDIKRLLNDAAELGKILGSTISTLKGLRKL